MRKLYGLLMFLLVMVGATVACFAVEINIDGEFVPFDSYMGTPFIDAANRTQVPLRVTMEACGCNVDWDSASRTAIVQKNGITVRVPIGGNYIFVNGLTVRNDTVAVIKDSRTYLPLRVVLEAFGADVNWDPWKKWVVVNLNGSIYSKDIIARYVGNYGMPWEQKIDEWTVYIEYVGNGCFNVSIDSDESYEEDDGGYVSIEWAAVAWYDEEYDCLFYEDMDVYYCFRPSLSVEKSEPEWLNNEGDGELGFDDEGYLYWYDGTDGETLTFVRK